MSQPPHIKVCVLIVGYVKNQPSTEFFSTASVDSISHILGVKPTRSGTSRGSSDGRLLFWEYQVEQDTWEAPELLEEVIQKFHPSKVKHIRDLFKLDVELQIKATVTDGFPCLSFSPQLMTSISDLGAFLDIDIIQTAASETDHMPEINYSEEVLDMLAAENNPPLLDEPGFVHTLQQALDHSQIRYAMTMGPVVWLHVREKDGQRLVHIASMAHNQLELSNFVSWDECDLTIPGTQELINKCTSHPVWMSFQPKADQPE